MEPVAQWSSFVDKVNHINKLCVFFLYHLYFVVLGHQHAALLYIYKKEYFSKIKVIQYFGNVWYYRCRKYFEDIIKRKLTLWVAPSSLCMCLCVCPLSWRGCMSPSSMCSNKLKASFLFSFRDEFIVHVHIKDY